MPGTTRPKPTPGEVARKEAREHAGHGHSAIAVRNRRRRIYQLTLRLYSAKAISEQTGWPLRTVERDLADLRREALLRVSTAQLQKDAAEQLEEFGEQRAKILGAIASVGPEHRNYPRLVQAWIELTKVRHVFLERAELRKALDQGGPPDASDLRAKPAHVIEQEMVRISQALFQRLDPAGYLKAVERMRQGDVIDVPALPAAEPEGEEERSGLTGDDLRGAYRPGPRSRRGHRASTRRSSTGQVPWYIRDAVLPIKCELLHNCCTNGGE